MTLNTILKHTTCTVIEITENEEHNFYSYHINYLRNTLKTEYYGVFEEHTTIGDLPKSLLKREVANIDINKAIGGLSIRLK